MFFPAFEMQRLIQTKILGKMFWKRHAEKRLLSSPDGVVRVRDIIGFRTKSKDPTGNLRNLHPIFQTHGLPSVYHYNHGNISTPTTPSHATESSVTTHDQGTFNFLDLDEPVRQKLNQQDLVETVLEITNTRAHRAAKMKSNEAKIPHEKLTPIQREKKK